MQQNALARIVDVSIEASKEAKDGLSFSAQGSYDSSEGNSNRSTHKSSLIGRYKHSKHSLLLMGSSERGKLEGNTYLESDFIHGRYRYTILSYLDWGLFLQKDRNRFRGLNDRRVVGTGPRFSFLFKDLKMYWGIFYMFEKEEYLPEVIVDRELENNRISTFFSFKWNYSNTFTVYSTSYFQPLIEDTNDFRLLNNSGFLVKINENLDYNFKINYIYDSHPPVEFSYDDRTMHHGFNLNF